MRAKLVAGVVALFVVVSLLIALIEAGPAVFTGTAGSGAASSNANQTTTQPQTAVPNNPIAQENAQQGSSGWQIPDDLAATSQIQVYAGATSIAPGQSITFYVSTQNN